MITHPAVSTLSPIVLGFKRLLSLKNFQKVSFVFFLATLFLAKTGAVRAETNLLSLTIPSTPSMSYLESSTSLSPASPSIPELLEPNDPLNSPHPVPWNWIVNTQAQVSQENNSGLFYYRTASLISPDGQYAAYTRIQLKANPDLHDSRVTSVMFLENLATGDLQTISPSSPIAEHLSTEEEADLPGVIAITIPVSWSANGDRILSRQLEGFFSTSDVSDYAVIWEREKDKTTTLSPNYVEDSYAVLLGWSELAPDQVLFRAGILGEEEWDLCSVDIDGHTALANNQDHAIVYGQTKKEVWTGAQALW